MKVKTSRVKNARRIWWILMLSVTVSLILGIVALSVLLREPDPKLRIVSLDWLSTTEVHVVAQISNSRDDIEWATIYTHRSFQDPNLQIVDANDHEVFIPVFRSFEKYDDPNETSFGYRSFPGCSLIRFDDVLRFPAERDGNVVFTARYRVSSHQGTSRLQTLLMDVPLLGRFFRKTRNRQHFGVVVRSEPVPLSLPMRSTDFLSE